MWLTSLTMSAVIKGDVGRCRGERGQRRRSVASTTASAVMGGGSAPVLHHLRLRRNLYPGSVGYPVSVVSRPCDKKKSQGRGTEIGYSTSGAVPTPQMS